MQQISQQVNDHPFKNHYYQHLWYILILPGYMCFFYLAEALITTDYWVSYLPMDDMIPFNEWFVIPYVFWYPYMVGLGLYLIFRDVKGFRRYMTYIGVGFMSCIIFCFIVPNGQDLRPETFLHDNFLTDLISGLYAADTNTNVCPSMHVVGSMAVVFGVFRCSALRSSWVRILTVLCCILICASTVFIKQHSILDVFVAIPWSIAVYIAVYVLPDKIAKRKSKGMQNPV